MSLIPDFKLGLWYAWIFMSYVIFCNLLPYTLSLGGIIDEEILKKATAADILLNETEKKYRISIPIYFLL